MSSKPIPGRADSHPRCVQMYGKVLAKWAPHKVKGDSRACPHRECGNGKHGTTFGGNPLGCAVGNAIFEVVESEGLERRVHSLGDQIKTALAGVSERNPDMITEVRG